MTVRGCGELSGAAAGDALAERRAWAMGLRQCLAPVSGFVSSAREMR